MSNSPVVGRDVELSTTIQAPADIVFDYLVDLDKLTRWMGYEGDVSAEPGGNFVLRVTESDDWAVGKFVSVDRPDAVAFTWGWRGSDETPPGSSLVTITLQEHDGATEVTLVHSGLCLGQDDRHEGGWMYFLPRLADAAVGQNPGPQSLGQ